MEIEDFYTGFSNYDEINLSNRKKAVETELKHWGTDMERYKTYRSLWKKAAEEDFTPESPLHVDIEMSDACNLRCQMCAHGLGTVKNVGFIDFELAKRLIDECAKMGVYSIKFNWRGEATLNQSLPQAIKYAKEKGILEVAINTNGLPKKEDLLIECAEAGIDRIIFSVDGFSKDTYEFIRKGGNYEKLLGNIHQVLEWKQANNNDKPFIRIQMVRTKVNSHEVDDFIAYWQDKVDDVRISDVMNRGQGERLSVGDQITVGRRRCPQPFQRLVVGRDGRVSPCCADWNQEFIIGSIHENSLQDIWNGERMAFIRKINEQREHDKIKICKNCYVKESYFWEKNEQN